MGYAIVALSFVFFLIVGSVQLHDQYSPRSLARQAQTQGGEQLASDMLRIASRINDWRYNQSLPDGELAISQLGMVPAPSVRIQAGIFSHRLWIWTAEVSGLVAALNRRSANSALACTVKNGRLLMSDGTDMGLALPTGVFEGAVVYLN